MRLQRKGDDLYPDAMMVSAHDVAAVLCQRLPDLQALKKHKLLYYCQAHHLASYGRPLFKENISAWDHGPVVGVIWHADKIGETREGNVALDEAELNTIGYVLSRYGNLTGRDLETLTHNEMPWQRADENRRPGESVRIEHEWMRDYYRQEGAPEGDSSNIVLDSEEVSEWLSDARERLADPLQADDLARLRAMAGRG
ncbi:Panacea domain-containing protein [Actinomadura sp. HBU206391]|uniref:Panacea domain-containing protein n=1 Tax=Actinomadura sp. HBU206391 TaxID=2731692 RepID=UPI001C9CD201|nr:Panacea domain-containing protein [Actinomadura sp. HBU206391]